MKDKVQRVAYIGMLSAVVMLATYAIVIPIPNGVGYFNLGDGVIFGIAAILGPYGAICAALGSALADLIVYPIFIPATFVIKGIMGLIAGSVLARKPGLRWYFLAVLFVICELVMVGGYFLYETALYGYATAIGSVPGNLLQGLAGIVLGLAIVPLARRVKTIVWL